MRETAFKKFKRILCPKYASVTYIDCNSRKVEEGPVENYCALCYQIIFYNKSSILLIVGMLDESMSFTNIKNVGELNLLTFPPQMKMKDYVF